MSEVFWNHLEEQNKEINTNISSFNDSENNLKNSYEKNEKLEWAKDLALKQYTQQQELKEQKEKPILQEAKEWLDKQAMINEAKTMLYEKLGIDNNIKNNSSFENFEKWIVDTLILDNYDLAIQVYETNWKIILDWLSQLASWEWLKQIANAIWESIWKIWDWNAYEKWKAVADLWLIWTWIWATAYVWKKTVKLWMKQISKLRVNKERLVNSSDLKQIIWETNNKVIEIVPKKQLDFEKLVIEDIAKLWDKDRLEAWKFYLWKDITPEQQKAIIQAHNVWIDRKWAGINNYNQDEILEKVKILKESWFSKWERKILLEKWVCWKEVDTDLIIKELQKREKVKEFNTKIDRLWLTNNFIQSIEKSWIWDSKFWVVKRYEILNNKITDYFDKQKKWKIDSSKHIKFKNFNEFIEKRLDEINSQIKKWPKLTKKEANLIFSLTDNFLFNNLNIFLWWKWERYNKLIKSLSKVEVDWVEKLIKDIDIALNKMPDLKPWEWWFILRWDKVEFWKNKKWDILEKWDINELKIFSFCANNVKDTFIWKNWKDTAVYIIWKEWRIKDITKFSLWVNFWWRVIDKVDRTYNEWIILRNSDLYIDNKKIIWDTYKFNTIQIK